MIAQPAGFLQRMKKLLPPRVHSKYISVRTICVVAIVGVGLILFASCIFPLTSPSVQPTVELPYEVLHPSVVDVSTLVEAIRNATRRVTGGVDAPEFTGTARDLWYQKNPCKSREQLPQLWKDTLQNRKWEKVFKEYSKLHRECTQKIGTVANMSEYFLSQRNDSGCKFLVGGIPPKAGLGNKVLSMISGLLYAILTQRVFLVPAETLVPGIMCEPFEGSSWLFDPEKKFTPQYVSDYQKYWSNSALFYMEVGDARSGKTSGTSTSIYALSPNDFTCQPGARFFCDTEQFYLRRIPWLYVDGCIYYLPKLFIIPSFNPVLEELFPDRMALTHLLRTSMLPSDHVWRRIEQIYNVYLRHPDRRVGFQVRYRDGEKEYNRSHAMVIERVMKCALDNGILPEPGATATAIAESHPQTLRKNVSNRIINLPPAESPERAAAAAAEEENTRRSHTVVFITSLFPSLHGFLSERYTRNPPAKEDVSIIQVTHGSLQHFNDIEEDRQALTEMITLSFSDVLFVTPFSTFGGVAQGYGAITPWFIDIRPESKEACSRAQTVDTCYQLPVYKFQCPYDVDLNNQWILAKVPYLKNCLSVDVPNGIQLITSRNSTG